VARSQVTQRVRLVIPSGVEESLIVKQITARDVSTHSTSLRAGSVVVQFEPSWDSFA